MSSFTFCFITTGTEYVYDVAPNIVLHLHKNNHSVAILEFTDKMNNKINIPEGMHIYNKEHQTNQHVLHKPIGNTNMYGLCWTDDYAVEYNNNLILNIKHNKSWDIAI